MANVDYIYNINYFRTPSGWIRNIGDDSYVDNYRDCVGFNKHCNYFEKQIQIIQRIF